MLAIYFEALPPYLMLLAGGKLPSGMAGSTGLALPGTVDPGKPVTGAVSGTKYTYNMIENPGPLASMRENPASNFCGGKYNAITLKKDTIFYRVGKEGTPLGQWFTLASAESVA